MFFATGTCCASVENSTALRGIIERPEQQKGRLSGAPSLFTGFKN